MAKVNGTLMTVYSGTDLVLHTTSCTLNLEQNLYDTTDKGSGGWAEHGNGLRSWSIDFDGMYDATGTGLTADEIIALIVGRTADSTIKFGTSASAATGWTGEGTFNTASLTADLEDSAKFSGSITGNAALAAI